MAPKKSSVKTKKKRGVATEEDVHNLIVKYPGFHFRLPKEGEDFFTYAEGEICLILRHLKDGLELPIQSHLSSFFRFCNMVPAQFTPNSIKNLNGLWNLFSTQRIGWTLENLMALTTISSKEKGFYFIQTRSVHKFSMVGTPTSIHGWRDKYVFARSKEPWGFPTIPQEVDLQKFKEYGSTQAVDRFYEGNNFCHVELDVKTLRMLGSRVPRRGAQKATKEESAPKGKKSKAASEAESQEVPLAEEEVEEDPEPPQKRRKSTRGLKPQGKVVETTSSEEEDEEGEGEEDSEGGSGPAGTEPEVRIQPEEGEADIPSTSAEPREEGAEPEEENVGDTLSEVAEKEKEKEKGKEKEKEKEKDTEMDTTLLPYWWDEKSGSFCYKPPREQMVPMFHPLLLPSQMILPLFTDLDRQNLQLQSDLKLVQLQNHLAISSAMVARYITDVSRDKTKVMQKMEARKVEMEGELASRVEELTSKDQEVEECKVQLIDLKNKSNLEHANLNSQLDELKRQLADEKEKNKALEKSLKSQKEASGKTSKAQLATAQAGKKAAEEKLKQVEEFMTLEAISANKVREAQKEELEKLRKEVAELKAAPNTSISIEEAKVLYTQSDDFLEAMEQYGEYGFKLLKAALKKDEALEEKTLDSYAYLEVMQRSANGEL